MKNLLNKLANGFFFATGAMLGILLFLWLVGTSDNTVARVDTSVAWLITGFVAGLTVARWLTERRWRENAHRFQRIESGGKLYKVLTDGYYDWLVFLAKQ